MTIRTLWLSLGLMLAVGSVAADEPVRFSATDIDGKTHQLSDYADKVVIVNYWATWCPPCLEELPLLSLYHDEHRDHDVVVLGINFEALPLPALREFLDNQMLDFPVFQQAPVGEVEFGRVRGLPTTFFISRDRQTVRLHTGVLTREDIEAYVAEVEATQ